MLTKKKKQLVTDYGLVFNSEHGRRVWADLRAKSHIDKTAKQSNPSLDTNLGNYQDGQRSMSLYIFKMLNIDPYAERAKTAVNLDGGD